MRRLIPFLLLATLLLIVGCMGALLLRYRKVTI